MREITVWVCSRIDKGFKPSISREGLEEIHCNGERQRETQSETLSCCCVVLVLSSRCDDGRIEGGVGGGGRELEYHNDGEKGERRER